MELDVYNSAKHSTSVCTLTILPQTVTGLIAKNAGTDPDDVRLETNGANVNVTIHGSTCGGTEETNKEFASTLHGSLTLGGYQGGVQTDLTVSHEVEAEEVEGKVTTEGHVILKGQQSTTNTLTMGFMTLECESFDFEGTIEGSVTTVGLSPSAEGCKAKLLGTSLMAALTPNGCEYLLHSPSRKANPHSTSSSNAPNRNSSKRTSINSALPKSSARSHLPRRNGSNGPM